MLCWSCRAMKAPDDFYDSNRTTCKACVAKRKTEQRRAKRENRPPRRFTCAECGKEVEAPVRSGPTPKYCSRACKDAPKLRREKALRDQERANKERTPMDDWHDLWRDGFCAICNQNKSVYPFKAHKAANAPYYYACARCYLERLDQRR